jgi:signal transduction histidine kinase/ActR/RegA family two-component response regulator
MVCHGKTAAGRIMVDTFRETKHVDNSISRAADRKNQYYSLLYSEMAERKRVEENLRRSNLLLQALSQAQLRYVAGTELASVFSSLLQTLLAVTQAHQGFLREQNHTENTPGYSCLSIMEGPNKAEGESGYFAAIANQVSESGRIILVHPAGEPNNIIPPQSITTAYFLGLPISVITTSVGEAAANAPQTSESLVGVIVVAGRAEDFDPSILELMQPLVATCAQLIVAHRNDARRRAAELALAEERVLLAQRVAERTAELSFSNAELARTARAKDEFLATMNHELRTPLNAVLLYSESLQTQLPGPLNERQLRAATGIRESANHLLLLINDILDVAKMDAGKLSLDITSFAVENVCQSSLRLISEMAQKKRLELHYERNASVTQLDADERRLKQMLVNLLSNAVKFTPEGGKVGLEIHGDAENNIISFTVWDTGIGIAQADIKKLFQPFVQLDGSHVRQHGGTGLGLFLVYRMAELHAGSISVTSELHQGSRFTISLPWRQRRHSFNIDEMMAPATIQGTSSQAESTVPAEGTVKDKQGENGNLWLPTHKADHDPATTPAMTKSTSKLIDHIPSVLIADDNEANIRVMTDFLQEWHCRLLIARTGVEAVQQTKEEHPDLVLMDIQMPEMNGLDAIRLIRTEPSLRDIPIVALTALAMPGDRDQCLAAGANDYLSKPIQIERLTEVLNLHLKSMPLEEPL